MYNISLENTVLMLCAESFPHRSQIVLFCRTNVKMLNFQVCPEHSTVQPILQTFPSLFILSSLLFYIKYANHLYMLSVYMGLQLQKTLDCRTWKITHVLGECSLKNWYPKFIINSSYKNGNRLCQVSSLQTNFKYCCFGQIESTVIVPPFRD